jgi:flagellar protein FlaG
MLLTPISANGPLTRPAAEAVTATPAPARTEVAEADVRRAVKAANRALEATASGIEFSIDHDSGKTVVRITDKQTHQVIRQIPSQEMIEIARAIDRLQGNLLDQLA